VTGRSARSGGALAQAAGWLASWRWTGLAALTLAFVAYYWQVIFAGKLVSAADLVNLYYPYAATAGPGFQPHNPALTDSVVSLAPAMTYVRDSVWSGQLPLWNPYTEFGMPFFAQSQWGILSPLQLPFLAPPKLFGVEVAQTLTGMLKVAAAGSGAYLLARALRCSKPAAVFAGIAWMLGGYTTAWLSMPATSATVMLPWICLGVEATLRWRRPWLAAAGLASVMAVAVFGGHPEALLNAFYGVVIYGVVRLLQNRRHMRGQVRLRLAAIGTAIVLALGLVAVIIVPAAELLHHSVDSTLRELQYRGTAIGWNNVIQVFDPHHFNDPTHTGTFYSAYSAPWFAGVVTALAALVALVFRDRRIVPFVLMCVLALGIATNSWPWQRVEDAIPTLGGVAKSAPLVLWAFGLSMTGALGVDRVLRFIRGRSTVPWLAPAAGAALCLVLFVELYSWGHDYNPRVPRSMVGVPRPPGIDAIQAGRGAPRTVFLGHTMPFLLPMQFERPDARGYGQPTRRDYDLFMRLAVTDLRSVFNPSELGYPIANIKPHQLAVLRAANTRYAAWTDGRWKLQGYDQVSQGPLNVAQTNNAMGRAYLVSDYVTEPKLESAIQTVAGESFDPNRQVVLDEDPAGARPDPLRRTPGPPPQVTHYENNHVVVRARLARPGLLVLSDSDYPGWRASVDGKSVRMYRANGLFRAVSLPAGEHVVHFDFRPASVYVGAAISLVSVLFIIGLALFGRRRELEPAEDRG